MRTKRKLTLCLGIILFFLGTFLSPDTTISREVVVRLGQNFTLWQYESLKYEGGEKQTQFRVTFDQILFEGEKSFSSYETPLPGKKFVRIPFRFENMGPRPGARAPEIEGELKTDKGHLFPEKAFYYAKIQKFADPGEKGNGHLIFLIPLEESPVEVVGRIFGSFPYSEEKTTRFRLLLPKGASSSLSKLRGNFAPTIGAQSEIKMIDHYLIPGKNPQLYIEYENISKRNLKVFLGILWLDSSLKQRGQLDERGPIPPGQKEKLFYTLQSDPFPEKITSYTLNVATKSSEGESGLPPTFWHPSVYPVIKPTRVIETPTISVAPASIEVANISCQELSKIGKGMEVVLEDVIKDRKARKTVAARTQIFTTEAASVCEIFGGWKGPARRGLAELDRKLKNLEEILGKELPDVGFNIRPPKDVITYDVGDKIIKDATVRLAKAHLDITVPLWVKPLEKVIEWGIERLTLMAVEKLIMKELGYARISKPKIGVMTITHDKKTKVAWVSVDLEDLPEKYGWKNEGLYMSIPFMPEPPELKKIDGRYDYKVVQRGESTKSVSHVPVPAQPASSSPPQARDN